MSDDGSGGSQPKVERMTDKYNLAGGDMPAELERRWSRDDPDKRSSIRELETYFNTAIVKSVLTDIGFAPSDYSAEEIYELLDDDDAPRDKRREIETWLEQHGYDPEEVTEDFVSFQTIYIYLRDIRGAESANQTKTPEEQREAAIDKVMSLKYRIEKTANNKLSSLRNAEILPDVEYNIRVSIEAECPKCHRRTPLVQLIKRGGCTCEEDVEADDDVDHRSDGGVASSSADQKC